MEIKTKFNAGEEVVILHETKAIDVSIYSIKIEQFEKETNVDYWFKIADGTENGYNFVTRPEGHVFKSKEDLINQL